MEENIHDTRELNKIGLYSYLEEYEYPNLENLLESAIEKLHAEFKTVTKEYTEEIEKEDKGEFSNVPYIEDEIFSIQDRLLSIYEMIIVNDYKEFELILKRLLKASLDFEEKDFRSFNNLKPILKDKGIKFSEVKSYNDINDLRKVNNHIKHSKIVQIPNDLKQILEFKNEEKLSYLELMQFHKRVKDLRYGFISDLKEKIFSHLYEFDENRIENIASRMLKRMDSNHIGILIKKLKELK
ncbi:hypothetical protein [Winogradskyella costae]|uniref:hypothetical protein n=1 Tax=Winogradskyella costae TaxID=2697008 RepID=UPI0015CBF2A4|nr:hypothetical protein [Winogradskyella costae]